MITTLIVIMIAMSMCGMIIMVPVVVIGGLRGYDDYNDCGCNDNGYDGDYKYNENGYDGHDDYDDNGYNAYQYAISG